MSIKKTTDKVADDIAKMPADAKVAKSNAETEAGDMIEKKATKVATKERQTRKRIPLGTRNILTAPKKPGFVRRFVNDKGDRIQTFKDAGWRAAEMAGQVGDDKAGRATSMGSGATPSVGGGQRAVLMEIPEKYYKEDAKAKQDAIAKVEREIARNKPGQDGLDGQVKIS